MRVALYSPWVYLKGGIEKVILETIQKSRHDWVIFTNHYDEKSTFGEFKRMTIVRMKPVSISRDFSSVLTAGARVISQKIDMSGFDVLFIHSDGVGELAALTNHDKPVVCFCHTPLRIFFDEYYYSNYMKTNGRLKAVALKFFKFFYQLFVKRAWRRFDRVFVNSREVAGRVRKARLITEDKVEVLHPGIDPVNLPATFVYEKYFLVSGRIMWTKNIELAIKAFIRFTEYEKQNRELSAFKLLITGSMHEKNVPYYETLRAMAAGWEDRILFEANPSDKRYHELFSKCYAVLCPYFNEDWGIVPIEAMALAKPVLGVNSGGLKESILDGKTGYLCEPEPSIFAEKMRFLAENIDEVQKMGRTALDASKKYDWKMFVERIDSYIDEIGRKKTVVSGRPGGDP